MEEKRSEDWLVNLPLQTENIAFKQEEMIACPKCQRANPPNRLKCFYCGGELEFTQLQSQSLKPHLRKLENWERGYNVIFLSAAEFDSETKTEETAKLLKVERGFLQKLINADCSLPLARAESEKEAEVVQIRLRELGIETFILSDEVLAAEKPPRRLRGIEFFDDRLLLIFFNNDEVFEIRREDLVLIVAGSVFERKIEATEKYNKKDGNEILETTETASDETLIDLYSRQDSIGFRIYVKGFDFSALETDKQLLAKDNIKKLVAKLRQNAPNAKYVDDYVPNRLALAGIWEVEQKTDSQGLKREGFRKYNLGNLTTVNNLPQFTKYSRLQWHLL